MAGRALPPTSTFAGDDGAADATLTSVLSRFGAGEADLAEVLVALAGVRLLVPVLAQVEETTVVPHGGHGHAADSRASAGVVAISAPDGRAALPVFSSVDAMRAWRADARPVPADSARAALSAVEEGWEVLLLDVAGPVPVLVPRTAVWALAQQQEWRPAVRGGVVDAVVAARVTAALGGIREVTDVGVAPGGRAEVAVLLTVVDGLDRAALDEVVARVGAALAADETVSGQVDSLELVVRSARGAPGAVSGGGATTAQ